MAFGRKGSGVIRNDKSTLGSPRSLALSRRSAVLAPLALTGCSLWDDWFGE